MASDMPIGKRIQSYRLRRRLTQEIVAGRIGLSVSWLSQVERGVRGVEKWQTIVELAEVLEVRSARLSGAPDELGSKWGRAVSGAS